MPEMCCESVGSDLACQPRPRAQRGLGWRRSDQKVRFAVSPEGDGPALPRAGTLVTSISPASSEPEAQGRAEAQIAGEFATRAVDPLYLFACHLEWERRAEPSAGWELISAAQSFHQDTRAHARALLASSRKTETGRVADNNYVFAAQPYTNGKDGMKTPYGLEIIESCMDCKLRQTGFFCGFSPGALKSFSTSSHHSALPAGAILFVEGQTPRGVFVLCSGKVKLSITSREGKVLILKVAEAGDVLGLSSAISGADCEVTAETSMPCRVNFVSRRDLLRLLEEESEMGKRAAQMLSREFQTAFRDVQDLVLARSSAGKLAKLLLSCTPPHFPVTAEVRLVGAMTHEEMAQRIGASRETVTRLLSELKKKQLIRIDGATLVIRNRTAMEALAA